jgi:hypothetical protein
MKRANSYEKHIYCLEGNWNKNPRSNQSVKPILELLHTTSKTKYIYRKCNTKEDFIQGLIKFTQKRYANYTILYIAFHGRTNRICCGNEYTTLNEIANALEGKLGGKIVHFGSCSTLRTSEFNINDFIIRTGCSFISGYKRNVEYISSTAFELMYLDSLQRYCSYSNLKDYIFRHYSIFIDKFRFSIED